MAGTIQYGTIQVGTARAVFILDIKEVSMDKNSLASIIYEKSLERSYSQKLRPLDESEKQKQKVNNYKGSLTHLLMDFNNTMLKITQFNSGLPTKNRPLLNINQSPQHPHSLSPYKHFTVKRMKETKETFQKELLTPQILADLAVRSQERPPDLTSAKSAKGAKTVGAPQNSKLLITSKWKFRPELWDLDTLTNQVNSQSVVVVKPPQQKASGSFKSLQRRQEVKDMSKTSCSKERLGEGAQLESSRQKQRDKEGMLRKISASPRKRYIEEQKRHQELIEKEKREILETRKELNKNYSKPFNPPENISAFAYIVYEADLKKKTKLRKVSAKKYETENINEIRKLFQHSHKVVVSLNSRTVVEMASLTKIMTCIVVIDLARRETLNLEEEEVTIGSFEENIGGTSANIKKGEIYTVQQLLFGLMLPSGNDASLALAVWAGRVLLSRDRKSPTQAESLKKRDCYNRFILEMNAKAVELNLQKTKYSNSHGLSNPDNKSCCFDLGILCEYAMSNAKFREIVGCRVYEGQIKTEMEEGQATGLAKEDRQSKKSLKMKKSSSNRDMIDQKQMQMAEMKDLDDNIMEQTPLQQDCLISPMKQSTLYRRVRWENTHQLVQTRSDLYTGIKTGITTTAGPCLASCLEVKDRRFIVIVLNCKSMKQRIRDTEALRRWLFSKEGIKQQKLLQCQHLTE